MEDTTNTPTNEVAPQEVETQSEQVAPTEESADAPVETVEDTAKPSENWETRYKDLQSKFTRTAQEKAELERYVQASQQAPQQANESYLDAESEAAVQRIADQRYEQRKAAEFARKHADELKDPLLSSRVRAIILEQNARGQIIDQEDALKQAKDELDARIKPQIKEAQVKGEQEGANIAQKKAELGQVGETPSSQKVGIDDLPADEWAKIKGIPHVRS